MRKTDIIYPKNRAKRHGCGCPALHYSPFSFISSLSEQSERLNSNLATARVA